MFFLIIPLAFSQVNRTIKGACSESDAGYINVILTQAGATTNYAVEEFIEKNWKVETDEDYHLTDMGNKNSITFFKMNLEDIHYKLFIPKNTKGNIDGYYALDNEKKKNVEGDSGFIVRKNGCSELYNPSLNIIYILLILILFMVVVFFISRKKNTKI